MQSKHTQMERFAATIGCLRDLLKSDPTLEDKLQDVNGLTFFDFMILSGLPGNHTLSDIHEHVRSDYGDETLIEACMRAGVVLLNTESYVNQYGDSGTISRTFYLDGPGQQTWRTLLDPEKGATAERIAAVGLVHPQTHCQHAHDCCGHTYYNAPRFSLNLSEQTLRTEQSWYINI